MELFTYLMVKNDHNTSVNKDLFSYLLGKNQSGTYTDYSGTSLSINNTKKGKMKVNLLGNTSQTGTPTPSSPIPVNVVSGDNTINVCGSNVLPNNITTQAINGLNVSVSDDGTITINGTSNAMTYLDLTTNFNSSIYAGYKFYGFPTSSQYIGIRVSKSNRVSLQDIATDGIALNDNGEVYIALRIESGRTLNNYVLKPMLMNTEPTTYEPYTSTSYPIHLGEHWLGWIGDYKDRFIRTTGKNLCNITSALPYNFVSGLPGSASTNISVNSFDSTNLSYTSNVAGYQYILTNVIQLKPSTQYTIKFSRTTTATNNQWFIYDYDNGTYSVNYRDNNTNTLEKTFTTNNLGQIALAFGYGNVTGTTTISNIMLNEGSTATTYEPYGTNEWYLEKKIGKVVLDGSETGWASIQMSNVYGYYRNINNILSPSSASILGLGLSNYFGIVTPGQNWATSVGSNNFSINNSNYSNTYIRFTKGETTDKLADFKTWLGTNNVSVYYVYYTPTYTQITGTLKDELEAVHNAQSYKGTTNINQINNDLPFNMDVSVKVGS